MYKFVKYEMDGELKIPGSCKKNYFFISNLCKTWHFLTFVLKRLAYLRKLFTVRKTTSIRILQLFTISHA